MTLFEFLVVGLLLLILWTCVRGSLNAVVAIAAKQFRDNKLLQYENDRLIRGMDDIPLPGEGEEIETEDADPFDPERN